MSEHDTVLSTVSLLHQLHGDASGKYVSPYLFSAHNAFHSRHTGPSAEEMRPKSVEDGQHETRAPVKAGKQSGREGSGSAVAASAASNGTDPAALKHEQQRNAALDKQLAAVKAQLCELELKTQSLERLEQQRQSDLRDAEVKQQKAVSTLQSQLSEANSKAAEAVSLADSLRVQLQGVTGEKEKQCSAARRAEGETTQAVKRALAAEDKLVESLRQHDRSMDELKALQATVSKLQADSKQQEVALAAAKTAKDRAESASTAAAAALQRAEADRKTEEGKRSDEKSAALQLQSQHRLALAAKDATISDLQGQVSEATAVKSDMARKLLELETKGGERRGEEALLNRELEALKATRDSLMAANRKLEKQAAEHGIALTAATRHAGVIEGQLAVLQSKWQSAQDSNNTHKTSAARQTAAATSTATPSNTKPTSDNTSSYVLLTIVMLLLAANVAQYLRCTAA